MNATDKNPFSSILERRNQEAYRDALTYLNATEFFTAQLAESARRDAGQPFTNAVDAIAENLKATCAMGKLDSGDGPPLYRSVIISNALLALNHYEALIAKYPEKLKQHSPEADTITNSVKETLQRFQLLDARDRVR